jgi:maltose alpha-D-glucosyltransferase/alpha-amylase
MRSAVTLLQKTVEPGNRRHNTDFANMPAMTDPHPTLRVEPPLALVWPDLPVEALSPERLQTFLQHQRWYGHKAEKAAEIRVVARLPLVGADFEALLTVLEVHLPHQRARYLLPLSMMPADHAASLPKAAILCHVQAADGAAVLCDAVYDARFRRVLVNALTAGQRSARSPAASGVPGRDRASVEGWQWQVQHFAEPSTWAWGDLDSQLLTAEQSNTSFIFGEQAILKLFRRLEVGENPDTEIGAYLSRVRTEVRVPALVATWVLTDEQKRPHVAAMLQRFVPNRGDAWTFAVAAAETYFEAGDATLLRSFCDAMHELGTITRQLHQALAQSTELEAFRPEAIEPQDLERWFTQLSSLITRSLNEAAAHLQDGYLGSKLARDLRTLLTSAPALQARLPTLAAALAGGAGMKIRHHGDYHLGQVLRTQDDSFMVIDFEGEPLRPLQERRAKHCPLRDVAGMLRSLSYAAAVAKIKRRQAGYEVAENLAKTWEKASQKAFLDAYKPPPKPADVEILPASPQPVEALVELFVIEKACYELRYELNHRPEWVNVPLGGLLAWLETLPQRNPR